MYGEQTQTIPSSGAGLFGLLSMFVSFPGIPLVCTGTDALHKMDSFDIIHVVRQEKISIFTKWLRHGQFPDQSAAVFFAIDMAWSIGHDSRALSPCPHFLISYAYLTAIIILTFFEAPYSSFY